MQAFIRGIDEVVARYGTEALLSRDRVIDDLLDLRRLDGAAAQALIDPVLASVPGVSLVASEWALAELARIREVAAGSTPTTV